MNAFRADRPVRPLAFVAAAVLLASCMLAAVAAGPASGARPADTGARSPRSKTVGAAPRAFAGISALEVRPHDAAAILSLNVGLTVRHSGELDAVIAGASTPG